MTPDRWQQIKEIFNSALQYEPGERAAFLSTACAEDEPLRQEVESLITSHEKEGRFIDAPAYEAAAAILSHETLLTGQMIGRHQILGLLGKGGVGEVYLAEDTSLGRKVALKFLTTDFTKDTDRLRRFEQEARAASALNHPNILTIHEIGDAEGRRFIATEFIDGETLRQRLTRGSLEVEEAVDVAEQIATALAMAHTVGIVHRDIKPENIMLRRDGIVKVLDFGLVKLTEQQLSASEDPTKRLFQTSTGMVMGTVAYMSPEQARGLPVDARTDIWSLGVVLYEMMAGCMPFAGETASDVISVILQKDPPALTAVTVGVPEMLDEIVTKALTKDREERYQTIKDLTLDLQRLKQKLDLEAEMERTQPRQSRASVRPTIERAREARATISSTEYPTSRFNVNKTRSVLAIASVVILAIAVGHYFTRRGAQSLDTIAVLPFANAGGDPNTEYLSDGITESTINSLSQLPQLKVIASSTVFRFKGRETDPQAAGKELGVRAVMTGRLLQQGDNLIVSVELVNVSDGTQLWNQQYKRMMSDLATVQQDLSRDISERLRLKLSGEQQRQLNKGGTNNTKAYELFLEGRYYARKETGVDFRRAIEQFRQATELDPNYALAYVALASCYTLIGAYAGSPASETLPNAKAAIERALEIDNSLAEAHAELGALYFASLQWEKSENEYQRAISLNPNEGHLGYSNLLRAQMRYDEALREIKRAQELDPLNSGVNAMVARGYHNLGDLDTAIKECKRVIALDPNFPLGHLFLGLVYGSGQGRYDEAIPEFKKAVDLSGRGSYAVTSLAAAYARSGKRAEARALLEELEEKYARREANGTDLAISYAALGDNDRAIVSLEKDFETGNTVFLAYVQNFETLHEPLRNDPRYQDLLRRMGLKVQ